MADTVELIKQKITIVDVVTPYVKLTRSGRHHRGLSPFNKEKTPSFFVDVERGSYYCFSSSQGGDMFSFIQKMEGVDFKGALKILAEKAGVELTFEKSGDKSKSDRLREALLQAETFYAQHLEKESGAYKYALSRGLTTETITLWNLGFAPDGWRSLLEELTAKGFTVPELLSAGLIKEADGKPGTYYDRFRNRLMFPIRDSAGRTVAFTGRALDPDDQAKYLNSPETELFKKHQIFFGMDRAKDAIRTRGFAILVEGQFDLILLHQIGFTNTIALSGTALSVEHVSLIKRYADNLMLALDSDRAGLSASAKSAIQALLMGMKVKAIKMPAGKDPADVASASSTDFTKLVADAKSIVEFFLLVLSESESDQLRLVRSVERIVLPLIVAIKSPLERDHFVGIVAQFLGQSKESVKATLPKSGAVPTDGAEPVALVTKTENDEPSHDVLLRAIVVAYEGQPLANRVKNEYSRIIGVSPETTGLSERALFQVGLLFGETPTDNAGDDLIRSFELSVVTERLRIATMNLRKAESLKDENAIARAMSAFTELSTQLSKLK